MTKSEQMAINFTEKGVQGMVRTNLRMIENLEFQASRLDGCRTWFLIQTQISVAAEKLQVAETALKIIKERA